VGPARVSAESRPAFYALRPGGWRDYVTLLHVPYTLWHLAYVVIGAMLVPRSDWRVLGLTLLAFALALGVGAHALDELQGRPLATAIPDPVLVALAAASIAAAAGMGVAVAVVRSLWLLAFVGVGAFLVVAYNLELVGGLFHSDLWFGLAWGGFPLLTASFAIAEHLRAAAVVGAVFATLTSLAQRVLSRQVRDLRRRAASVRGTVTWRDGESTPIEATTLTATPERALQLLTAAVVALAVALVLDRVA
jgi:hypothetical protein